MANAYDVNYDDKRFDQVESDKSAALSDLEKTYANMIGNSDQYYQDQIDATKQWADKQSQLQQEQTDFTIQQVEQQKEQAHKDYVKEQSGAYVDWRKQSNEYGSEAEKMASQGLANTGYSESSQVSMYNTYQNRVATARDAYSRAVLNYDNAITEARLQNNSKLAEIAYQALQQELELSLQGFQYKNTLILEQANKKLEVDQMYYNRYQDVLEQINHENAMAEQIRQFNQEYEMRVKEYEEGIRQFNEEIARLKKKDEQEYKLQIQELELKKKQLQEEKRQFDAQMEMAKASSSGGGGGGSSYTSTKTSTGSTGKQYVSDAGIDIQSITDLGRGPLSDEGVAQLVASGEVTATQKGNTIFVENNPNYVSGSSTASKYTQLAQIAMQNTGKDLTTPSWLM